ncbi:hypothetical protein CASFOL_001673 [Castilleja foliolosa]|uniref:Replication protein A 70 kDa DNA-binding subunit B/D first OB fold domain-containing protein n=1 Tax=Castilleja foliolosa TaxID=1961234 RepID=A0ABD3ECI3_9LAMI
MMSSYSVSSSVYVNISDLEPGKSELGLKVRVIRCYRQPSPYKTDPHGTLEMILHDEIEDRMHATIDFGVFKSKKIDIIEGGLYRIKLFMVAHDMTKYKSTTNRFKLRLTNQTSICAFQDPDFPSSMYRFRDLFEISNDISVDNFQLLDVIGRVVSFQKPTFVPKLSTNRMDFRIADTENRELGCSLWSEYIDPVLAIFEKDDPRPIIICIQFGKITRIYDEIKVSNSFHITKVTVNGDSDVFHNFLNRLTPDVAASQNNLVAEEFNDVLALFKNSFADVRKISEITDVQQENKFWVDATIAQIESKGDLWYPSCRNCFKKMPWIREISVILFVVKRISVRISGYKIEVLVADSSGCANMMMWDGQCLTLIGKSAKYIKQLNERSGRVVPQEITDSMVERRVLSEVKTPANKTNRDVPQFTVSRVAVDEEIFEMYALNYTPSKGSTTNCKNEVNVADNEVCSKLSKGKEKVDCEDELENEPDIDGDPDQLDGKDITNSEQILEDESEDCADDVSLKDLKEKKSSGYDAKYTSKNKKLKMKHHK